jgi:SAM-dependent methyltransferase
LRHQRATEASLAVRFGETAAALQAAEHRDTELRDAIDATRSDLADVVAALSARLTQSETFTQGLHANVIELRQLALTMNHWTVQVRKSIDAIEAAEAEQRARNDETSAAIILRAREHDAHRASRLQAWSTELAQRIPRSATVLDLAGGSDWLAALSAPGWSVSSIETNTALHREARARNLDVTLGSPRSLLARISDASLDALTIASPDRIVDEIPATELLREAHRILKPGGCLMIGATPAESSAEYAPSALLAVGFAEPKWLDASGGKALFAVRS